MKYFDRFWSPGFWIFGGFHEISDLIIVMGLTIPGIIIYTQLMFLNAWVASLEVNFWNILTDLDSMREAPCELAFRQRKKPYLHAFRAETMVDSLPRASRW